MAGLYVHIPFCAKKCSYCDFHFSTQFEAYRNDMVSAIVKEIELRQNEALNPLESIYFGGGTPSLLKKKELSLILESINKYYKKKERIEVTLEANPEDVSVENLIDWLELGINRLSIGIQSLKKEDLNWMNRGHSEQDALSSISLALKTGFKNISADLMYGLPGLTKKEWDKHLNLVVNSGITHLSAYCLTLEKGTVLAHKVKTGNTILPEDDQIELQYNALITKLLSAGFEQYEVSNFAYNKMYSHHNSSYWKSINYIGIGPSAHSFSAGYRRWNIANNQVYIRSIKSGSLFHEDEILSKKDLWNELFLTGFRTRWGVNKKQIVQFGGFSKQESILLQRLIGEGKVREEKSCYVLTSSGFLFADAIAQDFFRLL